MFFRTSEGPHQLKVNGKPMLPTIAEYNDLKPVMDLLTARGYRVDTMFAEQVETVLFTEQIPTEQDWRLLPDLRGG